MRVRHLDSMTMVQTVITLVLSETILICVPCVYTDGSTLRLVDEVEESVELNYPEISVTGCVS